MPSDTQTMLDARQVEESADWPTAEAMYRAAIGQQVESAEVWFRLGIVCLKQRKYGEAAGALREATRLQPDFAEAWSNQGVALASQGQTQQAEAAFRRAVELAPTRPDLLRNLGKVLRELGRVEEAESVLRRATDLSPSNQIRAMDQASSLRMAGKSREAIAELRRVLQLNPTHVAAIIGMSELLFETGELDESAKCFRRAINIDALNSQARVGLGVLLASQGKLLEACNEFQVAVKLAPQSAVAYRNLGIAQTQLGKNELAVESLEAAVRLDVTLADAHFNLGIAYTELQKLDAAYRSFENAIRHKPDYAEAYLNLGNVLDLQSRTSEAIACFEAALRLRPQLTDAHFNLGVVLDRCGKVDEAIQHYRATVQLRPDYAEAHTNLGTALASKLKLDEAIDCFRQALKYKPDCVGAHSSLAAVLVQQKKLDEAIVSCRNALRFSPNSQGALCALIRQQLHVCSWDNLMELAHRAIDVLENTVPDDPADCFAPSDMLALPVLTTAEQQRRCASNWTRLRLRVTSASDKEAIYHRQRRPKRRITLGYLSGDFRSHVVAHLVASLFEQHDKEQFELRAYSYGLNDNSQIRKRIEGAVESFVDLSSASFAEAAHRIAEDEVDILVDLTGYTGLARTEILIPRPAPIQVSFLGYAGSMAAPFMDFILVDDFVVPAEQQPFFDERLVHLPGCFFVSDDRREIAERTPSRAECGLPNAGFVFCCFNNNYKITPQMFALWMEILREISGSVLWLLESNAFAPDNLRKEAERRGVSSNRLVFAPKLPMREHLARYRLADLFLDTVPYNAHTTANDALWVGCPVLTFAGQTYCSRVAGSQLRALGLPELITYSLDDYRKMALQLAKDSPKLVELRQRLKENRTTSQLFDTAEFARKIEQQYVCLWNNRKASLAPQSQARLSEAPVRRLEPQTPMSAELPQATVNVPMVQGSGARVDSIPQHEAGHGSSSIVSIFDQAIALRTAGKNREAVVQLQRVLELNPAHVPAIVELSGMLFEHGQFDQAAKGFQQAIHLDKRNSTAYVGLGVLFAIQGKLQEAAFEFQSAVSIAPESAVAVRSLGIAQTQLGKHELAVESLETAVKLDPSVADAHLNLGIALAALQRLDEAIQSYRNAILCRPDYTEAYLNLGNVFDLQARPVEAISCYETALKLTPNLAEGHNNLGVVLDREGRLEEAFACFQLAVMLAPDFADAHNSLGVLFDRQRKFREAESCYEKAIHYSPDFAQAHCNLAVFHLLHGNWARGWAEYEWRWRCKDNTPRTFSQPLWDGSSLEGKTILLHCEQGRGDAIQFIRYALLLKNLGGRVILEASGLMTPLLSSCAGIDVCVTLGATLPHFDVHTPLMSLPRILQSTPTNVPCTVPYLSVDMERIAKWRLKLSQPDRFKIGVAWRGNPNYRFNQSRSFPLAELVPVSRVDRVQFYSLQKDSVQEEISTVSSQFSVIEFADQLDKNDGAFMDTAAVMKNLDLVISVDTSIAHLAGALGVPVWLALAYAADWRWMLNPKDTPWYPTMRLFRQPKPGDWQGVMEHMASELESQLALL